ncbi:hypothetical protein MNBD_UNCLBAC01-1877 [hydrothermal vent metagenome]|uniref:ATPase n=1 Tax=hydrothermal vent metagenome TaxID=652676 RepID=A0A3B1DWZ3_9ZZZZ
MFSRNIIQYFVQWKDRCDRKPLVVRGARQVGKTAAVEIFAKKYYEEFISLNLDKEEHISLFQHILPISELIQLIQLKTGKKIIPGKTLLFIDEIQNSSVAMMQLRYLYEEMPQLPVIVAGSLLEVKIQKEGFSFPVGRVEYCYMHPVTFDEFLMANDDAQTVQYLESFSVEKNISDEMHEVLLKKYFEYVLIGGMPEVVAKYVHTKNIMDLDVIYESILRGFQEDVYKYATRIKAGYLQHIIEHSPRYVGQIIKYEKFGESGFRSREMREAFDILEKAMIVRRVYASSSKTIPIIQNLRKSPKLLFLDSGLVNYYQGLRVNILEREDLNNIIKGQFAEQLVGQALYALNVTQNSKISYWYREKSGATAEVDYLIFFNNKVIPLEVKAGKVGRLKSLHKFMEESQGDLAIRICSNKFIKESMEVDGNRYILLSIPFYLLHRVYELLP